MRSDTRSALRSLFFGYLQSPVRSARAAASRGACRPYHPSFLAALATALCIYVALDPARAALRPCVTQSPGRGTAQATSVIRVTGGHGPERLNTTTINSHSLSRLTQTYTMSTAVLCQTVAPLGACGRADRLVLLPVRALARHAAVRDSLAAAADHVFLHGVLG